MVRFVVPIFYSRFFESASFRIKQPTQAGKSRNLKRWLEVAFFLFFTCVSLRAQSVQFLPEVHSYLTLNSMVRSYFQAKDDREGGDPSQATLGPSIQVYLKPLLKLKKVTTFDLDDAKPRAMVLEIGYRYITVPNAPPGNRLVTSVTFHLPMKANFLITDRNRADLDWKDGKFSWRYRNKLTLERTVAIHSYHLIPYAAVEPFYESQYEKWSTTSLYFGSLVPVGKHVEFDPYYQHDNNTGKHPNQQANSVGLAIYLYFSVEKK